MVKMLHGYSNSSFIVMIPPPPSGGESGRVVSVHVPDEVPMATTGSERQLVWVFQRATESSTLQMNLVNMSMASSAVFRKMKLLDDEENNSQGKPAKQQKSLDKKEIAATVKGDLQSIGLASSCTQKGDDGANDDENNGQMNVDEENDPSSLGADADPKSLSKKQNLSGQKGHLKSKLWTGFHPEEQKTYSSFVTATDGSESRHKTALDEVLGALLFMRSFLQKDGSKEGSLAGGAERAKKRPRKDASSSGGPTCTGDKAEDVLLATMQFCIGIWMEFCFTGEVVANGKLFKRWSSLRTELQQIVMTAQDSFLCPSSSDPGRVDQVDPLNVAKLLCKTFASKPVSMIIFDDAEEANIKRVTTVMQLHHQDIAEPLKLFTHEKLHLPLMLLEYPMQSLRALTTSIQKGNMRTTVDLMAFLHSMLQTTLPFAWSCFAQDVSDLLTAKGHFIEKTEQAGKGLVVVLVGAELRELVHCHLWYGDSNKLEPVSSRLRTFAIVFPSLLSFVDNSHSHSHINA